MKRHGVVIVEIVSLLTGALFFSAMLFPLFLSLANARPFPRYSHPR